MINMVDMDMVPWCFPSKRSGGGKRGPCRPCGVFFPWRSSPRDLSPTPKLDPTQALRRGPCDLRRLCPAFGRCIPHWWVWADGPGVATNYSLTPRKKNVYVISLLFFHMFLSGRNTRRAALKLDINMGCLHWHLESEAYRLLGQCYEAELARPPSLTPSVSCGRHAPQHSGCWHYKMERESIKDRRALRA